MPDILVPNAALIGLYVQTFASGVYAVYLPQCVVILRKKVHEGLSWWLPLGCFIMFAITALNLIVAMVRGYQCWGVPSIGVLPNPTVFWEDSSSPLSLVKNITTVILAVVSDMIMVYRTFVVWNCRVFILVPLGILLLGTASLGIWSMWILPETRAGDALIVASVVVRLRYFYVVTFCLNVICAVLIYWKVRRVSSAVTATAASGQHTTSRVVQVFVETAAFYCAHLFAMIVTDSAKTNLFFIFLDSLPPVTALVFTLMIVRARHTRALQTSQWTSTASVNFWGGGRSSENTRGRIIGEQGRHTDISQIVVEIDLEAVAHRDTDSVPPQDASGDTGFIHEHDEVK